MSFYQVTLGVFHKNKDVLLHNLGAVTPLTKSSAHTILNLTDSLRSNLVPVPIMSERIPPDVDGT